VALDGGFDLGIGGSTSQGATRRIDVRTCGVGRCIRTRGVGRCVRTCGVGRYIRPPSAWRYGS